MAGERVPRRFVPRQRRKTASSQRDGEVSPQSVLTHERRFSLSGAAVTRRLEQQPFALRAQLPCSEDRKQRLLKGDQSTLIIFRRTKLSVLHLASHVDAAS